MEVIVGIVLSACALEDWRTKRISVWLPLSGMALGVLVRAVEDSLWTEDFWFGLLIGLFALAIAAVSRGQIGSGDGLILTVCGSCLGGKRVLVLLLCSMLMLLVVGVGGIMTKQWTGKKPLAFVPFIWCSFLVDCLTTVLATY